MTLLLNTQSETFLFGGAIEFKKITIGFDPKLAIGVNMIKCEMSVVNLIYQR